MEYDEILVSKIPQEIIEAEEKVSLWFRNNNIFKWKLGHSQDRNNYEISISGMRARLFGTPGILGTVAGMSVFIDDKVPENTIELRDSFNGRVLGRIINVGHD